MTGSVDDYALWTLLDAHSQNNTKNIMGPNVYSKGCRSLCMNFSNETEQYIMTELTSVF